MPAGDLHKSCTSIPPCLHRVDAIPNANNQRDGDMSEFVVRGLPKRLARDAWWMAADSQRGGAEKPVTEPPQKLPKDRLDSVRATLLLGAIMVVAADVLVWQPRAGLGVVFAAIVLGLLIQARSPNVRGKVVWIAWTILLGAALPAFEMVQSLSVGFLIVGLVGFTACFSLASSALTFRETLQRSVSFLSGILPNMGEDAQAARQLIEEGRFGRVQAIGLVRNWAMPVAIALVFVGLFAIANPVLDHWIRALGHMRFGLGLDPARLIFAGLAFVVSWPFLSRGTAKTDTTRSHVARALPQIMTPQMALRVMVLCNLVFAVQSMTDLTYLWGGVHLPDGMSYASYAHRGAYPLLVAAVLAGGFAILLQPVRGAAPVLRVLLLIWVGQTLLLVVSSVLRLDLYVDTFGLTRLRFAAFVWMGLVAVGVGVMFLQILMRWTVGWLLAANAAAAGATLYLCCFVNVAGFVAQYNLARPEIPQDRAYLCSLGTGAVVAISDFTAQTGQPICDKSYADRLMVPADLREWGYRNWRLRHNLAQIQTLQNTGADQ